jgi:hypothetical protein
MEALETMVHTQLRKILMLLGRMVKVDSQAGGGDASKSPGFDSATGEGRVLSEAGKAGQKKGGTLAHAQARHTHTPQGGASPATHRRRCRVPPPQRWPR